MKKGFLRTCIFALALLMIVPAGLFAARAEEEAMRLGGEYRTRAEIIEYITNAGTDFCDAVEFETGAVLEAPYETATLTNKTLKRALAAIKDYRYVAGLDTKVIIHELCNEAAARCALALAAQEAGETDPAVINSIYGIFSAGGYCAMSMPGTVPMFAPIRNTISNTLYYEGWGASDGRYVLLNPSLAAVGFGAASLSDISVAADEGMVMYSVFPAGVSKKESVGTTLAWPAPETPTAMFDRNDMWSVTFPFKIDGDVKVTLTKGDGEASWTLLSSKAYEDGYRTAYCGVDTAHCGEKDSCVVFRAPDLTISDGDVFHVSITGANIGRLEYDVNFFDLPEHLHTGVENSVITEPTCTEDGAAEYECDVCGETVIATITATGHTDGKWVQTQAPTCTETGMEELHCQICDEVIDTREVPAAGHKGGQWNMITYANCYEDGFEERRCSVCGELLETRVWPAHGHLVSDWITVEPATCLQVGRAEKRCTICNELITFRILDKTAHTAGDWETDKPATCNSDGRAVRKCVTCGKVMDSKVIPAEHKWDDGVVTRQPSCTEVGTVLFTCTECGETKNGYLRKNAHAFGAWQTITPATDEAEGERQRTCYVCGEKESESIPRVQAKGGFFSGLLKFLQNLIKIFTGLFG